MIKKRPTVTIGIPAYNEEANIAKLLKSLVSQNKTKFILERIIVVSDASTDGTVKASKSVKDKRIHVINAKKRRGVIGVQNYIFDHSRSEIVVLLDADILPSNEKFIEKLIRPIIKKNADLTGADMIPVAARTFIERIIYHSWMYKRKMFARYNNGNNIYNCPGRARAFSSRIYKDLRWPDAYCEDTYSYLYALENKFIFKFARNARVYFKSPETLDDHLKQSLRFHHDMKNLCQAFDPKFVKNEFSLPISAQIRFFYTFLKEKTVYAIGYIFIYLYVLVLNRKNDSQEHSRIEQPSSTKNLVIQ